MGVAAPAAKPTEAPKPAEAAKPAAAATTAPAPAAAGTIRPDPGEAGRGTGAVGFRAIHFGIGRATAGQRVCVMDAGKTVMIFDLHSTLIIEHTWPKPGTKYVSNGRPTNDPAKPFSVSDVLIHQPSEPSGMS